MLLAVDIGNTHTVAGLLGDGGKPVSGWRMRTDRLETPDELGIKMTTLFDLAGVGVRDIDACVVSSVVPPALDCWKGFVNRYVRCELVCVNDRLEDIMSIRYSRPYEVGADRIVNAVAAWEKYRAGVIVVDFGTAITFDCVSADREYLGGVIAPGPGLAASSLASGTSGLPLVDLVEPTDREIIAQDTVSAIQAGIVYGFAALTDGIAERLASRFPACPQCMATGGLAGVIIPHCRNISIIEPDLTLIGLYLIRTKYLKT